jgi:hypothetical protein
MKNADEVQEPWLLSIVELPRPLVPGDRIRTARLGKDELSLVYEVRKLASTSTNIGGKRRPLYVALHAGSGSAIVAFCFDGKQRQWHLSPEQAAAFKGTPEPRS